MPDPTDKAASADRAAPAAGGSNGERPREVDPRKHSPEAFGRAAEPGRRVALPDAFGRGDRRAARDVAAERETSHDESHGGRPADVKGDEPDHELDREHPDAPAKPPFYKRPVPMTALVALLLAAIVGGVLYWLHARQFETTDDAFITGHITRIAPRVAGQVTRVFVDDNQVVKAGDAIVELDPTDLQSRVAQAEADLHAAEGRLAEAQAQVTTAAAQVGQARAAESSAATEAERAGADLKRYEALDARAISQQQLDTARATARTAQANVNAARQKTAAAQAQVELSQSQVKTAQAQVQEAQAALDQDRLFLGYTKIVAPEDGRVTNKSVEPGSYVQTGQALLSLVPRDVWVIANFKETQITDMRVGQPVTVKVDAYPHKDFHAHVDSFQAGTGAAFSLLPPENATGNYVKVVQRVPVKIVFDEAPDDRYLLGPGMSVTPGVRVK